MSQLKSKGYAIYDYMDALEYEGIKTDYKVLLDYFEDLPVDDYAPELNRYRRYSRALVLPTSKSLEWLPNVERDGNEYAAYFQGKFNPEHPGSYREFHAIDPHILENELLNKIIMADYEETFWGEEDQIMPIHVGVHFVKLEVEKEGDRAVSSPDCLHQDGEPFTFAHLIERRNVKGGLNAIGVPSVGGKQPEEVADEDLHEVFKLNRPLESYGVEDSSVSHYVGPVMKGGAEGRAVRSVILIDYQLTVVADVGDE
ncbi:2OG-Fe dioxygenase family protein [Lacicoccus alkaliphilus]|uniref:2OG-Fe dioxygenase n=1 Tax=Lacicoccus alkaliphilus DSM 16010 TaxID=1123231 RepID=A0A1M7BQE0_9BACL|nr:2OG-Fe dioxygenase family protein [Salinicoccus alkaliphilus]SHL57268.1 hypothetical protein SAMN02745189_00547 [Salinicoccus alkaliphilus DSM 16010]